MQPLTREEIDRLRRINSPTIANAIEVFEVRPRNTGFLGPEVRCLFPGLGTMVGYAFTATVSADLPANGSRGVQRADYWMATPRVPEPRIAVIQDLDNPACRGSFWGEVNSNIHRALGFIGTVTNGSARDLEEMESLGFFVFAQNPSVSHAYIHLVDFGGSVRVGGEVIEPGDLLHGDRHGVVIIPREIASSIAEAAAEVDEAERELIEYCRSPGFTAEGLKQAAARLADRFLEIVERRKITRR